MEEVKSESRELSRRPERRGFTLVELLVVITIIGILMALLLPAVQSARESARRTQCSNNLKQLGLGMLNFEAAYQRFPSGGWGYLWVGDPDRGSNSDSQPGGWAYSILPFMDQMNLFSLGAGLPATDGAGAQLAGSATRLGTALAVHQCPSRRRNVMFACSATMYGTNSVTMVARTDYAANAGAQATNIDIAGPSSLATGDQWTAAHSWATSTTVNNDAVDTGVCFLRSKVTIAQISDGTSNTYLVGEKYLNPDSYYNGVDQGDNECLYSGYDDDIHRTTFAVPLQDTPGTVNTTVFGSAHANSFNIAFADGSVHSISYFIDATTHLHLGSRADGVQLDQSKY